MADAATVVSLQHQRSAIEVVEPVRRYLVDVVRLTRTDPAVSLGASPRASLALYRGAQAWALLAGRRYVIPDDVKDLAGPVLAHRLLVNARSRLQGETAADVVARAVEQAAVPVEDVTGAPEGAAASAVRGWEPDGLAYAAAAFVLFAVLGFVFHIAALAAIGTGGALGTGLVFWWQHRCLAGVTYDRQLGRSRALFGEEVSLAVRVDNQKALPLTWLRHRGQPLKRAHDPRRLGHLAHRDRSLRPAPPAARHHALPARRPADDRRL